MSIGENESTRSGDFHSLFPRGINSQSLLQHLHPPPMPNWQLRYYVKSKSGSMGVGVILQRVFDFPRGREGGEKKHVSFDFEKRKKLQ